MEIGEKYGRLTVVRELPQRNYGHVMIECLCDCGKTTNVQRDRLISGHTKSCGCMHIKRDKPYKGKDITGQRFGKLVAVEWVSSKQRKHNKVAVWKCRCDCGNEKEIARVDLLTGRVNSCGCYMIESHTKHGGVQDRLYPIWSAMRDRCNNPNNKSYHSYGGRGIKICKEWDDYSIFRKWALNNGYDPDAEFQECTIDRINNDKDYEPANCRFVDMEVQSNNRQNTIKVEMDGNIKSLKQWCNYLNCNYDKACHRKEAGKDIREWFDCELPYKVVRVI